ncbi:hypothetical protein [Planktothrix sp. FACHB-1365]|nr:hypothetical protein [Planktothrix sp. FACHB-1365]MBD2484420.1 hypothetical protein [Planktothrix sp. FACHB-1365]
MLILSSPYFGFNVPLQKPVHRQAKKSSGNQDILREDKGFSPQFDL